MDESNKKDNLTLIATYQDRVALLEDQLRVTEAELKLTQQERENYYYKFLDSKDLSQTLTSTVEQYQESEASVYRQLRSEKAAHQDTLSKLTALEHAVKDVGEALAAKDKEISRLKRIIKARNRPSLESYSSSCRKDKFAASFKCLPKDVCVGDILADCHSELKVTQVIEEDNVFHIHFGDDFEVFSSTEFVLLHELTSDGVPYGNLVDKTALEEAKKLIAKLTEQLDQQKISAVRKTPANAVKYPHYFREVTNTTHVDVSWFLKAFNVPCCEGHAIKKLLVSGQRGAKNRMQDLKEARDSIDRAIEMEEESQ